MVNLAGSGWTSSGVIAYDRTGKAVASDFGGGLPGISSAPATTVAYVAQNPNAHYIKAGPGAYPNSGRNTEKLSPINNIDLSILKRINFNERYRFELGGQFYNVLNHSQFFPGDVSRRTFTTTRNFLIPATRTSDAGINTSATTRVPRRS